jgi:hypothetical protein
VASPTGPTDSFTVLVAVLPEASVCSEPSGVDHAGEAVTVRSGDGALLFSGSLGPGAMRPLDRGEVCAFEVPVVVSRSDRYVVSVEDVATEVTSEELPLADWVVAIPQERFDAV